MPIDPSFAVTGPEWSIAGSAAVAPTAAAPAQGQHGFANALAGQLGALAQTQTDAATAARNLATGQASDPTAVVMAVERARLAMQLASQLRTKGVEAAQDLFHTQV
jgi:flagellar hook-basal body complex protein FliE